MNSPEGAPVAFDTGKQEQEESEEIKPREMAVGTDSKSKASRHPFSVESLISKKTPSSPGPITQPSAAPYPHRTYFTGQKGKVSLSFPSVSDCLNQDESEDSSDKEQSTWLKSPAFNSPPSKTTSKLWQIYLCLNNTAIDE